MKLTFYFPYQQISGVPILFAGIVNNISSFENIETIYVIDYENGALNRLIKDSKVIERIYFKDRVKVMVPEDTILIMQSIIPYMIREELIISSKTKILFWNLHPENLIPNFIPIHFINNYIKSKYHLFKKIIDVVFKIRLDKIKNFIELSLKRNGLVFMDRTNIYNTSYKLNLEIPNNLKYLPVPIEITKDKKRIDNKKNISVSWVGRVEGFKYFILKYILEEFSDYCNENKIQINFHLIGDGLKLHQLNSKNFNSNYFKLKNHGNLDYKDLKNFLKNNIDLAFAMGTSALDSANLSIPTVLVDYSFKRIRNYKFRWIFDTKDFDLAHDVYNNNYTGPSYEISDLVQQFIKNKKEFASKSRDYVFRNHDINLISKLFVKYARDTKLIFGDVDRNILKKSIFRLLYYKFNNYYTGTS